MKNMVIAAVAVMASTGIALATPGTIQVRTDVNFRTGSGGEFKAIPQAGSPTNIFGDSAGTTGLFSETNVPSGSGSGAYFTFCLEQGEFLASNSTNYRYTIDDYAVQGFNGGQSGTINYNSGYGVVNNVTRDFLSEDTKYLYYAFRTGSLSGYRYNDGTANADGNRAADGSQLQRAIWSIEDILTLSGSDVKANGWRADALAHRSDLNKPWLNQVRVLNIFTTTGSGVGEAFSGFSQSQLMLDVTLVPVPAAALTGMAGMMGLAFMRRRPL